MIRYRITQVIQRLNFRSSLKVPNSKVKVYCFNQDSFSKVISFDPELVSGSFKITNNYDLLISCKNEGHNLSAFLDTISRQSLKPKNIFICDAGENREVDRIIEDWAKSLSQIKVEHFKLLNSKIAQARNELIRRAKSEIVLFADLGTRLDDFWAERIMYAFEDASTEVSMGWYELEVTYAWQGELKKLISKTIEELDVSTFLPSTRSIGIKKTVFSKISSFNEDLTFASEDSLFGYEIKHQELNLAFSPDALVYWKMPDSMIRMWRKLMRYAKGDAETGFLFWDHYLKQVFLLAKIGFDLLFIFLAIIVFRIFIEFEVVNLFVILALIVTISRLYSYLSTFGNNLSYSRFHSLLLLVSAQIFGFISGLFSLVKSEKLLRIIDGFK